MVPGLGGGGGQPGHGVRADREGRGASEQCRLLNECFTITSIIIMCSACLCYFFLMQMVYQ